MDESKVTRKLSDEQLRVLRDKGTEAPGSGEYLHHSEDGTYSCAACGTQLFESNAKYDSRTPGLIGWPSFDQAIDGSIRYVEDTSLGMNRTEVVCANCGGHLGHVFSADDAPSGSHYCINSCSLEFKPR